MKNKGFATIPREILDTDFWEYGHKNAKILYVVLCLMVSHKPKQWTYKNKQYTVQPNELFTTENKLMAITHLTRQQLRTAFDTLEAHKIATRRTTNRGTHVRLLLTTATTDLYNDSTIVEQPAQQPAQQTTQQPVIVTRNKYNKKEELDGPDSDRQFIPDTPATNLDLPPTLPLDEDTQAQRRLIRLSGARHWRDIPADLRRRAGRALATIGPTKIQQNFERLQEGQTLAEYLDIINF